MSVKFKVKKLIEVKRPQLKVKVSPPSSGGKEKLEAIDVVKARHEAEITTRAADLAITRNIQDTDEQRRLKKKIETSEYRDENNKQIPPEKLKKFQSLAADAYRTFVILTDEQRDALRKELPKKINGVDVQVGAKAIFPHILDVERKKVAAQRVVYKMNRLKYISSDERRGLKLSDEDAQKVFDRYKLQGQAKKDLVRTLISLNYNDFEICESMDIKPFELARIKKEIFYEEITVERQLTNEERYAQYKMQQMEVVKDLDVLVERFKTTQQLQAMASALKTKADIMDKIIEKGYEFGVIDKSVEKSAVLVAGIDLTTAPLDVLEKELFKTNKSISKLLDDKSFLPALPKSEKEE